MEKVYVDQDWTFKEAIKNVWALKLQYVVVLMSFSLEQRKERTKFRRETRDLIYALNFEEWKRDKIWEFMNDYEDIYTLVGLARK